MTPLRISSARSLDAGAVGQILADANDALPWLPRVHTRAQEIMYAGDMIDAGWVQVARADDAVVGFLARAGQEIHGLYLVPRAQGRGIGRALLRDAQRSAVRLGLWTFQANARARTFYDRAGFAEVAQSNGSGNDTGLPDVRMEWLRKGE